MNHNNYKIFRAKRNDFILIRDKILESFFIRHIFLVLFICIYRYQNAIVLKICNSFCFDIKKVDGGFGFFRLCYLESCLV